ncbi:MAG TPA: hypothetical protein P5556_09860 [Candidatus Gastranaerophilales bacterium]|nr:hypothetical protein [Candidatus Gastranaerophilales bacterium]
MLFNASPLQQPFGQVAPVANAFTPNLPNIQDLVLSIFLVGLAMNAANFNSSRSLDEPLTTTNSDSFEALSQSGITDTTDATGLTLKEIALLDANDPNTDKILRSLPVASPADVQKALDAGRVYVACPENDWGNNIEPA